MRKLFAALLVVLAGCATPGQQITGPKGWVVMSLVEEVAFPTAYLSIRPVGAEGERRNIGIGLSDAFGMQQLDGLWGVSKAAAFKPGTYEIYNFFLEQGGTRTQYRSRHDFSLRFEVRENEIAYLGRFNATKTSTKDLVDWIKGSTPYFIRLDRRESDVATAAKATPELQGLPSRTVVLTPAIPTSLIRSSRVD